MRGKMAALAMPAAAAKVADLVEASAQPRAGAA
jgi:hypothetical protein